MVRMGVRIGVRKERREDYWDKTYRSSLLTGLKNRTVLDAGVEKGITTQDIALRNRVYGADIDVSRVENPERFERLDEFDFNTAFPYEDELFDVVVAFEILEHLTHPQHCLDECYRVLKRGGESIFQPLTS